MSIGMMGFNFYSKINAIPNLEFIDKIGLKDHLSPTRSNGLISMIKQMKLYALVFKTKKQTQEKN